MWLLAVVACVPWFFDSSEEVRAPQDPGSAARAAAEPIEAVREQVDPTPFPSAPAVFRRSCLDGWRDPSGARGPIVAPGLLPLLTLPSCASNEAPAPDLVLSEPIAEAPAVEAVTAPPPAEPSDPNLADDVFAPAPAPRPRPAADEAQLGAKQAKSKNATPKRKSRAVHEVAESEPEEPVFRQRFATYDWGGTVYLSNDDSMSLASAQRVLFALSRGVPLQPQQVRPHELLNYFSFDTLTPTDGQTFGVLGGAEQEGDVLTVALSVRGASPPRPPLDLTVVVDRSCSMKAEDRVGYTKRGLKLLAGNLHRGDRLDVVLFDTGVCTPLEGYVVGRDDPAWLDATIDGIALGGGTDLGAGLQEAYRIQTGRTAAETHGRARRVLLLTDAQLNSGNVSQHLVSDVGTAFDQHGIRLSGVGVGLDFNDEMLDLLTEKGRGAYVYLGSDAVVDRVFGPGFDSLVQTVANDVRFSLDLPPSLAMEKFYGEEMSTTKAEVDPINYQAGTTQLFLQDLKIKDGHLVPADPVTLRIEYRDTVTQEPAVQELRTTVGALLESDPHNVRKGKALMAFADLVLADALGADACGDLLDKYRFRVGRVPDDAEIGFVNGLVGRTCGVAFSTVAVRGVELKVRVDADIPIGGVRLACGGPEQRERLTASDAIALFSAVPSGSCTLRLDGTTPMVTTIDVPPSGGDVRCVVRGGRMSCG